MATKQFNIRLPVDLLDEMDSIIKTGDFHDRAEFVKYALRRTVSLYSGRGHAFPEDQEDPDLSWAVLLPNFGKGDTPPDY